MNMPSEIRTRPNGCRFVLLKYIVFTLVELAVLIGGAVICYSADECVETTGNVHIQRLNSMGNEISSFGYSAPFSVKLADDGRFIIKLYNHNHYKAREITFSFDGTNYFYVLGQETNAPNSATNNFALAYLSSEEIPLILYADDARDALWYSLCSGNYFKKHGESGEILQLFHHPRFSIEGYGFRYAVILTNSVFCLPYNLKIWKDNKYDKLNRKAEEGRLELDAKDRGSPLSESDWRAKLVFRDGSLSLNLQWKQEYKLGETRLPREVELEDFYLSKTNQLPCYKIDLEFNPWQLSSVGNETFRPADPKQPTRVLDARVRIRDGIHYLDDLYYTLGRSPTNSHWYSTNDPWIQRGIEVNLHNNRIPGSAAYASKQRSLILAVLFFITLYFGYLLFLRSNKITSQQQTNKEQTNKERKANEK